MKLKYFDFCKRLSLKSNHHQHKLGACIVKKNKIIGFGYNVDKTHTKSPHKYKRLHAEVASILGLPYEELRGSTIYVYRETKSGDLALARPCASCYEMIKLVGIKYICYSSIDGYKKEEVI